MTYDDTISEVKAAIGRNGRRRDIVSVTDQTVISRDGGIDGIDVWDFAKDLERTFGEVVWQVPWGRFSDQRASFYGCATVLVPFWLLWRLVSWPFHGEFIPPPNGGEEELTVGHLASVLSQGAWFEPR